jgi:hypothetical protein
MVSALLGHLFIGGLFRSHGGPGFLLVFADQALKLEGLGVLDALGLGGGARTSVDGSAVGVGVFSAFLGVCWFTLGPGVDGVDVEEDVDDWKG